MAGHRYDNYHRLWASIYTSKGSLYNYFVVKQGLARVAYIKPPNTQHFANLESGQSYAKSHKLGIWPRKRYVTASGYNYSIKNTTSVPISSVAAAHGLSVIRGQNASVTVKTKRRARGTINVYYKSGISKAKGLKPKTASSSGKIT